MYAGFIDAGTSALLDDEKKPKPQPGRKVDFSRYVLAATRPDNRNFLTPTFKASEGVKSDSKSLTPWREAGFTAIHVLPKGRISSGQGSLISANAAPLRETLLAESTMDTFRLYAPGGSRYPVTLMGCTAHLRQTFLDARRYALHHELYRDQTPNISRPLVDTDLEIYAEILDNRRTPVFQADTRDDIRRMLTFCAENDLRPILWGAKETLPRN